MNVRPSISIFCLVLCAMPAPALHAQERPKQQAKNLAEKAEREGGDRARQVQDYCQAAQLDPKEQKYTDTCNSYRSGLIQDDTALLVSAIAAYKNRDLDRAESQAKQVTSYDQKLSGQAGFLLDLIKNQRLLNQVQAAWSKGDFDAVTTLSQGITNSDTRTAANTYINNVNLYNGYIAQAGKLQNDNPQEAINQLGMAQKLNPNGPGNLTARIADLQRAMVTKKTPPQPTQTPTPKTASDSSAEIARKVGKLLTDARNSEKQGNAPDALSDYAMVLKLQPGNQEAQSSSERLEQAIKNDPVAAKNELTSAIRYFYRSQFDDAQRALNDYLKSPQTAQNPGAAYFYLGAALLEESMLTTPTSNWQGPSADVVSAFVSAHNASYHPVRTYVSPSVLKIWDSTSQ